MFSALGALRRAIDAGVGTGTRTTTMQAGALRAGGGGDCEQYQQRHPCKQ
ncbi:hypothetical protein QT383_05235 [Stenotrophomonas rhizophila]